MGKLENGPVQMPNDEIGMYADDDFCEGARSMCKAIYNVSQDPVHRKWLEMMVSFFGTPENIADGSMPDEDVQFIRWDPNR